MSVAVASIADAENSAVSIGPVVLGSIYALTFAMLNFVELGDSADLKWASVATDSDACSIAPVYARSFAA